MNNTAAALPSERFPNNNPTPRLTAKVSLFDFYTVEVRNKDIDDIDNFIKQNYKKKSGSKRNT